MCQDGGMIWECNEPDCGHAVCSVCVEVPDEEIGKLELPNVRFTCVRCHWKWKANNVPYLVHALSVSFHVCTKLHFDLFTGVYN